MSCQIFTTKLGKRNGYFEMSTPRLLTEIVIHIHISFMGNLVIRDFVLGRPNDYETFSIESTEFKKLRFFFVCFLLVLAIILIIP